jgi:hypothetical protein
VKLLEFKVLVCLELCFKELYSSGRHHKDFLPFIPQLNEAYELFHILCTKHTLYVTRIRLGYLTESASAASTAPTACSPEGSV